MTEIELQGLTVGDKVYVRAEVFYVDRNGRECKIQIHGPDCDDWMAYAKAEDVYRALPGKAEEKPKHDPCRLFRKGDIVRLKEWNGRCPALPDGWEFDNGLFKVHVDEKFSSSVAITRENSKDVYLAPICFLELVTPVEERETYYVERQGEKSGGLCYTVRKRGGYVESVFYFGEYRSQDEQQAKAAAEAERDRLNAEYGKEQNK